MKSADIVVISNIFSDLTEILLQRVIYRIERLHQPLLTIIITKQDQLSSEILQLLETMSYPYIISSGPEETPYSNLIPSKLPSLIISPFNYLIIDSVSGAVKKESLKMDESLGLRDNHIHTQMAWCSKNMEIARSIELAKIFGLKQITVTEHSGHLYFAKGQHADRRCYTDGLDFATSENHRVEEYLHMKRLYESDFVRFGLEVDFDFSGRPVVEDGLLDQFDFILGSIHQLEEITEECYLKQLECILKFGVDAVAHPLRIFPRNRVKTPETLFKPMVELFIKSHTAVELNFHCSPPPREFVKTCLDMGVDFSFGSDSHNLAEIGDFIYHLRLLDQLKS